MPKAIDSLTRGRILEKHTSDKKKSAASIARELNLVERTVSRIINLGDKRGSYAPLKQPGAPKKLSDRAERSILRERKFDINTTNDELGARFGVSGTTIRQLLKKDSKLQRNVAASKPYINRKFQHARIEYGKENQHRDWDAVIFTDECSVETGNKGKV